MSLAEQIDAVLEAGSARMLEGMGVEMEAELEVRKSL